METYYTNLSHVPGFVPNSSHSVFLFWFILALPTYVLLLLLLSGFGRVRLRATYMLLCGKSELFGM